MADLYYHPFQPSAWIEVSGEDAPRFLQGQFSNNLNRNEERPVTYGLWLDAKGKIEGDSFVLASGENRFYVFSYYSPAAELVARLEKYIIADDVEVVDRTDSMRGFSIWGSGVSVIPGVLGFPLPGETTYGESGDAWVVPGRRTTGRNFDVLCPKERWDQDKRRIETSLHEIGCVPVGEVESHYERIRSGIPAVPLDLGPRNLAQEGRIEDVALSYTKGCYTGQEVMSRLRTMGKVRRRLVRVAVDGNIPALPCPVYTDGGEAGTMTSSGCAGDERIAFVLILRSLMGEADKLSFRPSGDGRIRILDSGEDDGG